MNLTPHDCGDELPDITARFTCEPGCPYCGGDGIVCENHPLERWDPDDTGVGCGCGAGMPCRPENRQ